MYHCWIVLKYFLIIRLFLDFYHLEDQRTQMGKPLSFKTELNKLVILQTKAVCVQLHYLNTTSKPTGLSKRKLNIETSVEWKASVSAISRLNIELWRVLPLKIA